MGPISHHLGGQAWVLFSSLVIKHAILSPNHLLHSHTTYPTSLLYSLFVPSLHPLLPLLPLPYCNPSCCPLATLHYISQASTPRADFNMADQVVIDDNASEGNQEVNTATNLARLWNEGKILTPQELKELSTRIKALEDMVKMEDWLKALENRKHPRSHESSKTLTPGAPLPPRSPSIHHQTQRCSQTETDNSDSNLSSSTTTTQHCHKRWCFTKGIKVIPSYTLRVSLSLWEWGDWKKDIERVFEGDPFTYRTGAQKILKALDYLDSNLKSLWYTFSDQQKGVGRWSIFINWTWDNIQNGQNATATLYEQLNTAKQMPERSPVQFNAYLSAIERDLPHRTKKHQQWHSILSLQKSSRGNSRLWTSQFQKQELSVLQ